MRTTEKTIKMQKQSTAKGLIYYTIKGYPVAKKCSDCKYIRPITKFNKGNGFANKRYECRTCTTKYDRQHSQSSHGRVLRFLRNSKQNIKVAEEKFGITVEDNLKNYHVAMVQGNDECSYCGRLLESHEVTLDHVRPFKQGGANDYKNLLPSCSRCNSRKGDKPLYQFLTENVDEYYRKKVIFELSQKNGITFNEMEQQFKLDRIFNLYVQDWKTLEREGLTHLFKDETDFENQRRIHHERTGKTCTQGE